MVISSLSRLRFPFAIAIVLLFLTVVAEHRPASAADFAVTKTDDTADGTCDADCSLREAVIAANAAAGDDTITLPAGTYTLTIAGAGEQNAATGDLDVFSGALTINGAGAASTIIESGAGDDRVFDIDTTGSASISGVTIRNGGGVENGGGILVLGTLTLTDAIVTGNSATGAIISGGGIFNGIGGNATITDSVISGNTATGGGGGIVNSGGTLTLDRVTVSGNVRGAQAGGGIWVDQGSATITNSLSSGNTGEGIAISVDTTVTLENSTLSSNSGGGVGGGINNAGTAVLASITISDNTAGTGGGIFNNPGASIELTNTIIANSGAGGDCGGDAVISLGHNLDSDNSCGLAAAGDLPDRDPLLGPLADNGGSTETHALLAGSPAIDAGDDAACPATDQRAVARPIDGDGNGSAVCDIGAYEAAAAATATPTTGAASPTPTQPGALPPTGGDIGSDTLPLIVVALALLVAVALAAVGSMRALRRER